MTRRGLVAALAVAILAIASAWFVLAAVPIVGVLVRELP